MLSNVGFQMLAKEATFPDEIYLDVLVELVPEDELNMTPKDINSSDFNPGSFSIRVHFFQDSGIASSCNK